MTLSNRKPVLSALLYVSLEIMKNGWWCKNLLDDWEQETESYNGRGSIHFFPILCDASQLVEQFQTRTSVEKSVKF